MTPSVEDSKRAVGHAAAELVSDGMVVGLGTGSTARHLVDRLGERVRGGLRMRGVPTSERTARQARELGIPLATLEECGTLDLAIDGADQIDPAGDLIKGLGGALLREKRVAEMARGFVIIADPSKEVRLLGEGCPVPVEVRAEALQNTLRELERLGAEPRPRLEAGEPYVTDNGNRIVDAHFGPVAEARALERLVNELPGVLETGLFVGMTTRILVGAPEGVRERVVRPDRAPPV